MVYYYILGLIFIACIISPGNFVVTLSGNVTVDTTKSTVEIFSTTAITTPYRNTSTSSSSSSSKSSSSNYLSTLTTKSSTTIPLLTTSSSMHLNSSKTLPEESSTEATILKKKNIVYGNRVIKRYERDPTVLRINGTYFHLIGNYLNSITEAWLSTFGHCIEEDTKKINVKLFQQLETEGFARNASVTLPESDQIYHFCAKSNDTLLKYSFEAWRQFNKLSKEPDLNNFFLPIYIQIPLIVFLAFLSALFSGLNVGLMSLSVSSLELIIKHDPAKKQYAQNILPLRRNGNLLLCTILIGNTFVNNAVTLLISNLIEASGNFEQWLMFILSVLLPAAIIVFIGEIIPQAICCRYGLIIGSRTRFITIFFIVLTFVVSYPLSKILDWLIGVEGPESFDVGTLEHIIYMNVDQEHGFTRHLADIARRALQYFDVRRAADVMTIIEKVFMLPDTEIISEKLVRNIAEKGYTRIPIYKNQNKNDIIGIINVKDLVPIDQKCGLTIGTVLQIWQRSKHFRFVLPDFYIQQLLKEMKRGQSMAFVIGFNDETKSYKVIGIIALEDIIEELTGEILDEKDIKRTKTTVTQ